MADENDNNDVGLMLHDPLDDVDSLHSSADDILADAAAGLQAPADLHNGGAGMDSSVDLGDALTIREVTMIYDQLLQGMNDSIAGFVLLAGDLHQVDGAGLQMLVAFVCEAQRRDIRVVWSDVSPALRDGAEQMGVAQHLRFD
jgi:anti-anti-sigma regulatory factor